MVPILKMRKIEAREGWGGRGLKFKVSGQEGRIQSSPSSSGHLEEVGLGDFRSLGKAGSGNPGNQDVPTDPGLGGDCRRQEYAGAGVYTFPRSELGAVMMGLTIDSPIRFFRLTRTPHLGLGSAASLHRPETGTESQGVSQKVSLLQNDSKEAFTTPFRV